MSATLLIPALLLDSAFGEPKWLWNRYPHPAVLMGRAVGFADAQLNHGSQRRAKGVLAMAALGLIAAALGWLIHLIPDFGVIEVIVAAILLAQKSLVQHVRAVGDALRLSLPGGRQAVSMIVGRDTSELDEAAISRAATEAAAAADKAAAVSELLRAASASGGGEDRWAQMMKLATVALGTGAVRITGPAQLAPPVEAPTDAAGPAGQGPVTVAPAEAPTWADQLVNALMAAQDDPEAGAKLQAVGALLPPEVRAAIAGGVAS
jgi:hypothetical protein